jgi:P27 family predicted phage terminase small subunit
MGQRGPAPKPHEMRIIEGGVGKGGRDRSHRPAKQPPKYAPLTDHPPDWLPREAKAEWRRLMAEFSRIPDLVQRPDRATLTAWCQEWARYVKASKDVNERGTALLVEEGQSTDGQTIYVKPAKNPNVQVARDSLSQMIALSSRYGLTPGDRARLNLNEKGAAADESPLAKLLTGGSGPDR